MRFRVVVHDRPEHTTGDFATEDLAQQFAKSYVVRDRLAVTVLGPAGDPVSRWEPLSLTDLTELQVAIYEYVRARDRRTPPVNIDELTGALGHDEDEIGAALTEPMLDRYLHRGATKPDLQTWLRLDYASVDAVWRRSPLD